MLISAQYRLNPSGRSLLHSTVRLGSGAVPRLVRVWSIRKEFFVTRVRPSTPMPPMDSVTQVGSPPKSSLYSGVRRWRTSRSLMTNWSISSWAPRSSSTPRSRSRWM